MFIKYDEYELLELFLSEPKSLTGNIEDGEISYSKKGENDFKLSIHIYTYRLECSVFLQYNESDVFSASLENVTDIKRKDNLLEIYSGDSLILSIIFRKDFLIILNEK